MHNLRSTCTHCRYPVQVKIHFWDDQIKNHFELQSGTVQKVSQADDGQTIKTFYVHNKDIFVTALHFKAALNIYAYWMHLNIDIEQAVAQLRYNFPCSILYDFQLMISLNCYREQHISD